MWVGPDRSKRMTQAVEGPTSRVKEGRMCHKEAIFKMKDVKQRGGCHALSEQSSFSYNLLSSHHHILMCLCFGILWNMCKTHCAVWNREDDDDMVPSDYISFFSIFKISFSHIIMWGVTRGQIMNSTAGCQMIQHIATLSGMWCFFLLLPLFSWLSSQVLL